MNKLELLLTPRQAAEFLGLPESTLAQWRSQRKGPLYVELESRLVRYRSSDLETYIGQHLVETKVDKAHA
jgi:predicted DNA-binding transcriptional regulator AlpA